MKFPKFKFFLSFFGVCAFVAGFFYGGNMVAYANPFKAESREERVRDSRKQMTNIRVQPNKAQAHRKRVLEALERESGRDRSKKMKATLRVPPRKAAERTNYGFQ